MIKYTELRIYPNNKIPLVQAGFLQGDHNTVFTAMNCLIRSLERKKESYCYRVESEKVKNYVRRIFNNQYKQ